MTTDEKLDKLEIDIADLNILMNDLKVAMLVLQDDVHKMMELKHPATPLHIPTNGNGKTGSKMQKQGALNYIIKGLKQSVDYTVPKQNLNALRSIIDVIYPHDELYKRFYQSSYRVKSMSEFQEITDEIINTIQNS